MGRKLRDALDQDCASLQFHNCVRPAFCKLAHGPYIPQEITQQQKKYCPVSIFYILIHDQRNDYRHDNHKQELRCFSSLIFHGHSSFNIRSGRFSQRYMNLYYHNYSGFSMKRNVKLGHKKKLRAGIFSGSELFLKNTGSFILRS